MNRLLHSSTGVIVLALFCCLLWGSAAPCIKLGYASFGITAGQTGSILLFAAIRFLLAGILVLIMGIPGHITSLKDSSFWKEAVLLALFQTAGQYFFYYLGVSRTTGVSAAVLTGTGAFFTLLASVLVFRLEPMRPDKAVACALGFLGVLVLNGFQFGSGFAWNGEGFILLSQICSAVSACLIQVFSRKHPPMLLSGMQFLLGGLMLLVPSGLMHGRFPAVTVQGMGILFWLAFVSAAAYTIWGFLLKYNPVSRIAVFDSFIPVAGVFLSGLLLQEWQQVLSWNTLLALVCILAGIGLLNRPSKPEKSSSTVEP